MSSRPRETAQVNTSVIISSVMEKSRIQKARALRYELTCHVNLGRSRRLSRGPNQLRPCDQGVV